MTLAVRARAVACVVASFLLMACDPPGKPKAEASQAEDREKITNFQTLFQSNCSGCHGNEGLNGAARTLHEPLYLAVLTKQRLHDIIQNGRPGTAMPAWAKSQGGPLTDQQVNILANGIYQNWARPSEFTGANMPPYEVHAGGNADNGKKLFLRNCFMCHGRGALVGPVTDANYTSLVSDQYIRSAIIGGRPDLGMPDYRSLSHGGALSDQDITDLVAYISSFRPADVTAAMQAAGSRQGGQQAGGSGSHEVENGSGSGNEVKGNEGSGNGPGSPGGTREDEGNKGKGKSSQRGSK